MAWEKKRSSSSRAIDASASKMVDAEPWSVHQWLFLVVGCLTIGATNGCYAFFAPFFPPVAESEEFPHLHEGHVALIFSAFSAAQLVAAPLAGAVCSRYGRAAATKYGVVGLSASTLAFGLVPAALGSGSAGWLLAGAFCALRGAQGLFSTFVGTALLAAIASSFEEGSGRGKAIAAGELAGSFGWTLAPALGAVFFEAGGFVLPFAVFALLPLTLLPVLVRVFPLDAATDGSVAGGAGGADNVFSKETWRRFGRLASYSRLLVLTSVACTFTCWSAFDMGFVSWLTVEKGAGGARAVEAAAPALAPEANPPAKGYALKDGGRFFSVAPFWYGACSIPAGFIVDKVERKKKLLAVGFVFQVVAFGSFWPVLAPMQKGSYMSSALILIMSLCGMGAPLLIVPAMPDMLLGLTGGGGDGDGGDDEEQELQPRGRTAAERSGFVLDDDSSEDEADDNAALVAAGGALVGTPSRAFAKHYAKGASFARSVERDPQAEEERNINSISAMFGFASAFGNGAGPLVSATIHFAVPGPSFPAMITGVAMFELLLMFLILRFEYNEHRGSARGEYAAVAIGEGEGDGDALSEREEAIERDVARATD